MRLVYKFRHPRIPQLELLSRLSKNLYNEANYIVRQEYFKTKRWLHYYELNKQLKDTSSNYRLLKAQTSQQITRIVDKNWSSYFASIKDWRKHPEKYKRKPRIPKYKDKDGHFMLVFTNQNCKLSRNNKQIILTMSKTFKATYTQFKQPICISIPHYPDKDFSTYQQVRILPKQSFFEIEIVYLVKNAVNYDLSMDKYLAIDLGVNNLVTAVENSDVRPFIISGRILKSINQFWNKERARLMSVKDKQKLSWTQQLNRITQNRNSFVHDFLHKTARFIIDHCMANRIGTICLGKLKGFKDSIRLGSRNNQNFVSIPLQRFKSLIKYKAELVGITVVEVNEAYTSKCSALDLEAIRKHKKYAGRRVKRGMFKGLKYLLNADVNGALNILRKVIGDGFIRIRIGLLDRGCWSQPIRIRDVLQTSYKQFLLKTCNNVTHF